MNMNGCRGDAELFWPKEGQEGMEIYLLRLYMAGPTGRNRADLENLKKICRENLESKWHMEASRPQGK